MTLAKDQLTIFLVCAIFESIVWGIAFSKLVDAMMIMRSRANEKIGLPVFIAAPVIFILATLHLIGVVIRTFRGFVEFEDPRVYFSLLTTHENTVAQAGQVGTILVSDLLSVYRVWIVCDNGPRPLNDHPPRAFPFKNFVIPGLGFLTTLASAIVWVNTQRTTNPSESFYENRVYIWTLTFLSAGLFTTAMSTLLIARRLWRVDRDLERQHSYRSKSPAGQALRIFVESAALYSITNLLYMAFYAAEFRGIHSVFSTLSSPIASITFSLITIRAERALRPENQTSTRLSMMSRAEPEQPPRPSFRKSARMSQLQVPDIHLEGSDTEENGDLGVPLRRPSSITIVTVDDIAQSPTSPRPRSSRSSRNSPSSPYP